MTEATCICDPAEVEQGWMRLDCPVHCPDHLREDAMHYTCTVCQRKSWDRARWRQLCDMPQPDGTRCPGQFE